MWMSSLWVTWKMAPVVASIAVHLAASIRQHRLALKGKSHSETRSADERLKTARCPLLFWSRRKQKREYLKVLFLPPLHWCSAPGLSHCTRASVFCCLKCRGIIHRQNFRPLIPLYRFQKKKEKNKAQGSPLGQIYLYPGCCSCCVQASREWEEFTHQSRL